MSINKKIKKKDESSFYLKLDNGKTIKIQSIENYFDPDDEYNELYKDSEKIYPDMPKA